MATRQDRRPKRKATESATHRHAALERRVALLERIATDLAEISKQLKKTDKRLLEAVEMVFARHYELGTVLGVIDRTDKLDAWMAKTLGQPEKRRTFRTPTP